MILKGRAFDYLGGVIISDAYINIKNDLNALYFAGAALSLVDKQIKEDAPDVELYDFLVYWLELLNTKCENNLDKDNGELLFNYFSLRFLSILGYKPELHHCLDCHHKVEPGLNYFNLRQGGIVCAACFEENKNKYLPNEVLKISDDCIKILRLFCQLETYPSIKVEAKLVREISRLIKSFIIFN
jgi:DNA repair protein RecO (recombination protein O)